MRKTIWVVTALAAAATMLGTAGASTGSATTSGLDLRNTAAVDSYLRSIGIDPATVVRQTGLLNYAGPNCPGAEWNCTTSARVVQVAPAGGSNVVELSSNGPPDDDCFAMQGGPASHNKVHCKMRSTSDNAMQEADIYQNGERNTAIVDFDINSRGGPEQDAIQTARVEQDGTEKNDVHIKESVTQSTSLDLTQSQEAHQVAIVDQEVTGSENYAHVHQSQDQRESGDATLQEQNTGLLPSGVTDCSLDTPGKTRPNTCANISQSTPLDGDGAAHKSHLHQSINQDQTTKAAAADQFQGDFPGGIEGEIDPSNPPGLGTSDKQAHQDHRQRQSGPNGTEQQQIIDPDCCGFGTTVGGAKNNDHIVQRGIASQSEPDEFQVVTLRGETNHVAEPPDELTLLSNGPASDSRCKITHHAAINDDSTHATFDESCNVIIETTCTSPGAEGEGCFSEDETPCAECFALATIFPSAATLGLPIQPANLGEPDGFTDPLLNVLAG
jgi:hypothetical protein